MIKLNFLASIFLILTALSAFFLYQLPFGNIIWAVLLIIAVFFSILNYFDRGWNLNFLALIFLILGLILIYFYSFNVFGGFILSAALFSTLNFVDIKWNKLNFIGLISLILAAFLVSTPNFLIEHNTYKLVILILIFLGVIFFILKNINMLFLRRQNIISYESILGTEIFGSDINYFWDIIFFYAHIFIAMILAFGLSLFLVNLKFDTFLTVITIFISLIALSATLTGTNFSYSGAMEKTEKNDKKSVILFECAKRFYIATIFSILALLFVLIYIYLPYYSTQPPLLYIVLWLSLLIIVFASLSLMVTLNNILGGIMLSIKVTVQ